MITASMQCITFDNHIEQRRKQYREWLDTLKRTDHAQYLKIRKAMIAKKLHGK